MFLTLHDAKMRLEHTVIRHKADPVYVHSVDQPRVNYTLFIEYLRTNVKDKIPIKDPTLDFSPVPLGNINHEGNVYYASRTPQRMWKQGLHMDNFMCKSMEHGHNGIPINCKAIINTILNEYPTIHEGHKRIEDGELASCAFSRHFSLVPGRVIVFNCKMIVGIMRPDLVTFDLNEKHMYLKEHLQDSMLRN